MEGKPTVHVMDTAGEELYRHGARRLGPHTPWLSYAELTGVPDLDFALVGPFARALRTTALPSTPRGM
jgi:hypothetical protein